MPKGFHHWKLSCTELPSSSLEPAARRVGPGHSGHNRPELSCRTHRARKGDRLHRTGHKARARPSSPYDKPPETPPSRDQHNRSRWACAASGSPPRRWPLSFPRPISAPFSHILRSLSWSWFPLSEQKNPNNVSLMIDWKMSEIQEFIIFLQKKSWFYEDLQECNYDGANSNFPIITSR